LLCVISKPILYSSSSALEIYSVDPVELKDADQLLCSQNATQMNWPKLSSSVMRDECKIR